MGLYDQTYSAQDALRKLRGATASAIAAQKIAQRDYEQAQAEADKWEKNYQLALKNGRLDLVSTAQFQKERYKAIAGRLKPLVEQQTPHVDTLKRNLTSWESRVSKAENEALVSRLSTISRMLAFERMEEKVLMQEARAQSAAEVVGNNLESQFAALESGSDVDDELAALKAQMSLGPATPQNQASLPPFSGQSNNSKANQAIEDDLEKLKKLLNEL